MWHSLPPPSGKCIQKSEKKSQLHQDMWAAEMNSCESDKFYIDMGAHDGEHISNTYLLDKKYNWRGVCVDPYPQNMEPRSCIVDKSVLYDKTGEKVTFRNHSESAYSGIEEHIEGSPHDKRTKGSPTSTHYTASARDMLSKYDIPVIVDYLNMDVEGAELKILEGMVKDGVFDKHCFRAMSIEHNWVEPNRSQIRKLLESQGYTYYGSESWDDYYVHTCEAHNEDRRSYRLGPIIIIVALVALACAFACAFLGHTRLVKTLVVKN
tara:strand:+ start:57 stop:851 length:795 start_codon:yes stop_codon:yes gene_type:complete